MNKDLLLRVADAIEAHPEQFDMEFWDCGTTACIAGWAVRLGGGRRPPNIAAKAQQLLDMSHAETDMFYCDCWPYETARKYNNAPDAGTAARIAADYIREFVRGHET